MWIVLLDHSGSMGHGFAGVTSFDGRSRVAASTVKLAAAKQALVERLFGFGSTTRIAIFGFTSEASLLFEGRSNQKDAIWEKLDNVQAENGTSIAVALDAAAEYAARVTGERTIQVLVVSDGLSAPDEARRAALSVAEQGAIIHVILIDVTEEGESRGPGYRDRRDG